LTWRAEGESRGTDVPIRSVVGLLGDARVGAPVKFTPIRVVCNNTLTQALDTGFTHRARYDRDLRAGLADVKEALGLITQRYEFLEQTFDGLASIE
jgi:hypothetical protein